MTESRKPSLLFLIPVRAGSKRVPRKNIRPFGGTTLLALAIKAALGCRYSGRVLVSTDSEEIAEQARLDGAEVPFLRPAELASDTATAMEVIQHALDYLGAQGEHPEFICLVQVTSPLRTSAHLDEGLDLFLAAGSKADAVVGVTAVAENPAWMFNANAEGYLCPWLPLESLEKPAYLINGAFYAARREYLQHSSGFLGPRTLPYIMPKECSVDVDTPSDWAIAEALFQRNKQ